MTQPEPEVPTRMPSTITTMAVGCPAFFSRVAGARTLRATVDLYKELTAVYRELTALLRQTTSM